MAQGYELPGAIPTDERIAAAGAHLRASTRYALLIRAAKLIADEYEFPCIIRDASSTGVKVRLFSPLPAQATLVIELANGERYPAEMVWTSADHAGLRFLEEIAIERLLDETHTPFRKRPIRLKLALGAVIHSGGEAVEIGFRNISQQGASVECAKWLLVDELVKLETDVTPPIYAKVRWRNHPCYGLVFEQTFKLDELARVSGSVLNANARENGAGSPDKTSQNSR